MLCVSTMTAIATNFLNFPFAYQLVDTFKEYSNEYEFTAKGVFRRIIPTACQQCGKQMCHNAQTSAEKSRCLLRRHIGCDGLSDSAKK